jgi:hypothetical protein
VVGSFFLSKVFCFQFGLGAKGFVKKVVEKGQSEGKIAKTEEEKKSHDKYPNNHAPTISSLTANPVSVFTGAVSTITCTASDPDGDTLTYTWTATGGTISGSGSQISWTAPSSSGTYTITCTVSDGKGGSVSSSVNVIVAVQVPVNHLPTISSLTANPTSVSICEVSTITCLATDPDGDSLTYSWTATSGTISVSESGSSINWTSPSTTGTYTITCTVSDGKGGSDTKNVNIIVAVVGGVKLWTRQLGTASDDYGYGVATDSSGNIYVTGYTEGGLDGNPNVGSYDIFLIKYDTNGNKLWTRQLGTASDDYGYGVATDSSGNIYVAGTTSGGLDGNPNAGGRDIFLTKYDTNGNKLWTRQLGTSDWDEGYGVATDSSGNVYVTGDTYGGLDGNINDGNYDIFLAKYDTNGNKLWTRQLGTTSYDRGSGVATDASGNIYVTGYTDGGLDGNPNAGGWDIFLTKYDTNGNKIWTKQLGTASGDVGSGVATDSSGNIYVTGYTRGGLDGNPNAGLNDVFLTKYDTNGNKIWTKQLGTADYDWGYGVATDASGNIYVTGRTDGDLDGNAEIGYGDIFLTKYDTDGNKIWTRELGTLSYDTGWGVATDSSGNIYVTGWTNSSLDGNTYAGYYDIFLIKFGY